MRGRVRLTNRYGTAPVTFDAVRLARRGSGAGVVADTSRPVTFGGRRSVTIARGADAVSDPVRISFRPFPQHAEAPVEPPQQAPGSGSLAG